MAPQPHPRDAEEELILVASYEQADDCVRQGVDSRRLIVAPPEQAHDAMARAREGLAAGRGPLPLAPFDSGMRCLVVLPTYNEAANIEAVTRDILAYLDTDILIVDDGSPDGTGALADRIASAEARVAVQHRPAKLGLGTAYLAGFARAIEAGYDLVFEMDADFSHPPWDLPRLAALARHADLVIGSRYVRGGSTAGWDLRRRLLSRGANLYARTVLTMPVRDTTAGFRCYRVAKLAQLDLSRVFAQGYAFQVEMAYRMVQAGFRVVEIPIHFTDRQLGASKMDGRIAREAFRLVPALRRRVRRGNLLPPR
jgi:dolichol-phosphate mannosyltransferase